MPRLSAALLALRRLPGIRGPDIELRMFFVSENHEIISTQTLFLGLKKRNCNHPSFLDLTLFPFSRVQDHVYRFLAL